MDPGSDDRGVSEPEEPLESALSEADLAYIDWILSQPEDPDGVPNLFLASELPPVPDWMRKPPRETGPGLFDDAEEDDE